MIKALTVAAALSIAAYIHAAPGSAADLVLKNGAVYTVNIKQPWAEAVAIDKGRISFVGSNAGVAAHIKTGTRVVDLKGRFVMPGIHDVHTHPLEAHNPAYAVCTLAAGTKAPKQVATIRRCAAEQASSAWVMGWGHYIDDVLDTDESPAMILDRAVKDRPAIMQEFTSHSMWLNTAGLKAAGITAQTPNPPGGVIVKDAKTGEPTGLLLDNAGNMVMERIFAPNARLLDLTYKGIPEAMKALAAHGITSIADARVYWGRGHHKVWQRAEKEGILTTRVVLGLWAYPEMGDAQIGMLRSLYSNDPARLLRISQIKLYADGIISISSAAMKQRYEFDYGLITGNRGLNYFSQRRMSRFITALETAGFDFHIHAIGDRGTHEALNAIENAMRKNGRELERRHRLTHLELVDSVDVPRFAKLGVIADVQVAGDWSQPKKYRRDNAYLIGKRADGAFPLRSLHDSGAVITLSSDYDVSTSNPFVGMQNALTRGKQSLPGMDAVFRAYTINGAYALRQEDRVGSLETGKLADLIVLDRNLLKTAPGRIAKTKVLLTLLAGKPVYEASKIKVIE